MLSQMPMEGENNCRNIYEYKVNRYVKEESTDKTNNSDNDINVPFLSGSFTFIVKRVDISFDGNLICHLKASNINGNKEKEFLLY